MAPVDYYDIFQGANGQYYWNLHNGGNHAIIATGGEGFVSPQNAYRAVRNFQQEVANAFLPGADGEAHSAPSMSTSDIIDDVEDEDEPDHSERMERDSD